MDEMKIPIGRSGFADIRTNNYYYIDKSGLIRELLKTDGRQVTLITRPRRFGKTLAMSMLYLTGYLTQVREEQLAKSLPEGCLALRIPNREIKEIFESTIVKWFQESAPKWDRKALFEAVWNEDAQAVTAELTKLLRKTISYYDYREDFYHAFLAGIFAGAGYVVESNREHGEGRSDIIVQDYSGDCMAVFEVKYAKSQESLAQSCEEAIAQIDDRMYGEEFQDDYSKVICYGVSFYKKRCQVRLKEKTLV